MLDVLVPVLGRPQNAAPLVDSFFRSTSVEGEIHFLCSPSDEEQIAACRSTEADTIICPWEPARSDYPKKMNLGYRLTSNPWILLGSDDIAFTPGWFEAAMTIYERTGASVIATNDLANGQVMSGLFGTHCLIRREYVDEQGASADGPGVLIHEGYDHNFCDREVCHVAGDRQHYAFAKRSRVRHSHPNWKSAKMDDTYRKGLSTFREDQVYFFSRAHLWNYFGLNSAETQRAKGMQ